MPLDKPCRKRINRLTFSRLFDRGQKSQGRPTRAIAFAKEVLLMSDGRATQTDPTSISRRGFLKATGAGVAGGTLAAMLDARQAPAQIRATTLRILQWSHFIPAYDNWFDSVFTKEWGEKNGVKVRVDHIPHLELPARMAAEFAAGAGHDIIMNGSAPPPPGQHKNPGGGHQIYHTARPKHRRRVSPSRRPVPRSGSR